MGASDKHKITDNPNWGTSKYTQDLCQKAVDFLEQGKSITQLARHLKVERVTLYRWKDNYPEFARALEMGKDYALAAWEDRLEETVIVDGVANPQLMKFLFYTRFGISEKKDAAQAEAAKVYKPISLAEFYANESSKKPSS